MLRGPCPFLRVVRGQASPVVEDSISPSQFICLGGPNGAEKIRSSLRHSEPHCIVRQRESTSRGGRRQKPAPLAARITVSVIVRRKTPLKAEHITGEQRLTRAQFDDSHAADPAAVKLVQRFAKEFGLTVQPGTPGPGRRTMKLTGTVANMQR